MRQKRLAHFSYIEEEGGGLNLTPLIDVVFVVLIMFILIAPMLEVDKIKLAQGPNQNQTEAISPGPLVIHVQQDNTVMVNKRVVSVESLAPLLKVLNAKDGQIIPQLYQDERAQFGTYQMVKNAVEAAGFSQLDIILDTPHQ